MTYYVRVVAYPQCSFNAADCYVENFDTGETKDEGQTLYVDKGDEVRVYYSFTNTTSNNSGDVPGHDPANPNSPGTVVLILKDGATKLRRNTFSIGANETKTGLFRILDVQDDMDLSMSVGVIDLEGNYVEQDTIGSEGYEEAGIGIQIW